MATPAKTLSEKKKDSSEKGQFWKGKLWTTTIRKQGDTEKEETETNQFWEGQFWERAILKMKEFLKM